MSLSKKFLKYAFLPSLLLTSVAAQAADYKIDPAHSSVGFTVRHLVGKVKGQFKEFEGTFSFDKAKFGDSSGKFTVKTASIFTDSDKRDEHLRSGDFFDVQKFPEMTFTNVKFKAGKGKDKYKMTGDLNLHGIIKPITFDVEFGGAEKDPWGNNRVGFTADGKLNRKDFGIVWNKTLDAGGVMLGDDVAIDIQVEAVENKPADAKPAAATPSS